MAVGLGHAGSSKRASSVLGRATGANRGPQMCELTFEVSCIGMERRVPAFPRERALSWECRHAPATAQRRQWRDTGKGFHQLQARGDQQPRRHSPAQVSGHLDHSERSYSVWEMLALLSAFLSFPSPEHEKKIHHYQGKNGSTRPQDTRKDSFKSVDDER